MSTYVPDNCTEAMDYGLWYSGLPVLALAQDGVPPTVDFLFSRDVNLHLAANCRKCLLHFDGEAALFEHAANFVL